MVQVFRYWYSYELHVYIEERHTVETIKFTCVHSLKRQASGTTNKLTSLKSSWWVWMYSTHCILTLWWQLCELNTWNEHIYLNFMNNYYLEPLHYAAVINHFSLQFTVPHTIFLKVYFELTCSATALKRHEPSLAIGFRSSFFSARNLSKFWCPLYVLSLRRNCFLLFLPISRARL